MRRAFGEDYVRVNLNKHRLYLPHNDAKLIWMSGDDPMGDAGKGYTFSFLLTDESQDIPDVVMEKMQPALDVRMARIRSFGTPDITPQQTWFEANFMKGLDPTLYPDYHSFTLSCYENRWMSLEAIRQAKDRLSENEFRRLYLGEFVHEEGVVFRHIKNAFHSDVDYNPANKHVMSVDFGMQNDFTVVMVGEAATRRVIFRERWGDASSFTALYDRIQGVWERFGKPLIEPVGTPALGELITKHAPQAHFI